MFSPRQERDLLKSLNEATTEYSTFVEEIMWKVIDSKDYARGLEPQHIYSEEGNRNRWSYEALEVFKVDDYYVAAKYDSPLTEMQEGQPTNMEFFFVEPYSIEVTKYKKKLKSK